MVARLAYDSTDVPGHVHLGSDDYLCRSDAYAGEIGNVFDGICKIAYIMHQLNVDKAEVGCLRAILLLNPGKKGEPFVHFAGAC